MVTKDDVPAEAPTKNWINRPPFFRKWTGNIRFLESDQTWWMHSAMSRTPERQNIAISWALFHAKVVPPNEMAMSPEIYTPMTRVFPIQSTAFIRS